MRPNCLAYLLMGLIFEVERLQLPTWFRQTKKEGLGSLFLFFFF